VSLVCEWASEVSKLFQYFPDKGVDGRSSGHYYPDPDSQPKPLWNRRQIEKVNKVHKNYIFDLTGSKTLSIMLVFSR